MKWYLQVAIIQPFSIIYTHILNFVTVHFQQIKIKGEKVTTSLGVTKKKKRIQIQALNLLKYILENEIVHK